VVLQAGFESGHAFLAAWQAWRDDEHRCGTFCYVAIARQACALADMLRAHADTVGHALTKALLEAWPPPTPNLHRLSFEGGQVQLLLAHGEVSAWLPELVLAVDAFVLSESLPEKLSVPLWDVRLCKALGRLANPGATLVAIEPEPGLAAALVTAGFKIEATTNLAESPSVLNARFAPLFQPRRAVARRNSMSGRPQRVLIVGAGLAGCAVACALAENGWHSTLLDRCSGLAQESSGNPAGLFHGIVNAQDGVHARFNRAAALAAKQAVQVALAGHGVKGNAQGLLRLEQVLVPERMQNILSTLKLPAGYVEALSAGQASALSGMELPCAAWHYPGGGWVEPAGLARSFYDRAGKRTGLRGGIEVSALRFENGLWCVLDAQGHITDQAPQLVLANAGDALRLLATLRGEEMEWPIEKVRGQISWVPAADWGCAWAPRLPVAGSGYLLPEFNGQLMFGSTAQRGDADASVRLSDHLENQARVALLAGQEPPAGVDNFSGRTAWRWSTLDRLPVVGGVPAFSFQKGDRFDQPRLVPRVPGLYVCTALGSRGITWAALSGHVLASVITGSPVPLEAQLLDAIDPARFVVRQKRDTKVHAAKV
jgi:tRNA 5-methylaminomethyl-2-thiouridine biosynthesis bifunctional protein